MTEMQSFNDVCEANLYSLTEDSLSLLFQHYWSVDKNYRELFDTDVERTENLSDLAEPQNNIHSFDIEESTLVNSSKSELSPVEIELEKYEIKRRVYNYCSSFYSLCECIEQIGGKDIINIHGPEPSVTRNSIFIIGLRHLIQHGHRDIIRFSTEDGLGGCLVVKYGEFENQDDELDRNPSYFLDNIHQEQIYVSNEIYRAHTSISEFLSELGPAYTQKLTTQ